MASLIEKVVDEGEINMRKKCEYEDRMRKEKDVQAIKESGIGILRKRKRSGLPKYKLKNIYEGENDRMYVRRKVENEEKKFRTITEIVPVEKVNSEKVEHESESRKKINSVIMKMSKDNMRVRNEVNEKSEKKRKLDWELKVETGTRPKIRVRNVSPGISKIASIFEKGDQVSVEKKKEISNVLVKRNAIEKMMSDIKTRRVEKIKMKPNNKKCIKVTKNEAKVKNEGERKSMSEALEKWIRKEKIENDSCEKMISGLSRKLRKGRRKGCQNMNIMLSLKYLKGTEK